MNKALAVVRTEAESELPEIYESKAIEREPEEVLREAQKAAAVLKQVISQKQKPVKFNGEQYLEFEDWMLIARFYGFSVKIESSSYVEFGETKGFEARALVIQVSTGQVISAADAMCLNDEPNWKHKPLFQLKSMAQTRASAKAFRNVLAWVAVLAGCKPTPAEEMSEQDSQNHLQSQKREQPRRDENQGKEFWTALHKNKTYVFVRKSSVGQDFIAREGFAQSSKNPEVYFKEENGGIVVEAIEEEILRIKMGDLG